MELQLLTMKLLLGLLPALAASLAATSRRAVIAGAFIPAVTNAMVVPGGEFCICRPKKDGELECFGQNCNGLKQPPAVRVTKDLYTDELKAKLQQPLPTKKTKLAI